MVMKVVPPAESGFPYASRSPVLVVSHQINRTTMREMLEAFRDTAGAAEVESLLDEFIAGRQAGVGTRAFFVSVDGGKAPAVAHWVLSAAVAEAERLAHKAPNTSVRVLQQVAWRCAEQTTLMKGEPA